MTKKLYLVPKLETVNHDTFDFLRKKIINLLDESKRIPMSSVEEFLNQAKINNLDTNSRDSIVHIKMRAFISEGNLKLAYLYLIDFLKQDPRSPFLQLEFRELIGAMNSRMDYLITHEPLSHEIEDLYLILHDEGCLHGNYHVGYARYLTLQKRFSEAIEICLPLFDLTPGEDGLQDLAQAIYESTKDKRIKKYLVFPDKKSELLFYKENLTYKKTVQICDLVERLNVYLNDPSSVDFYSVREKIYELTGKIDFDTRAFSLELRDLYYYLAIVEIYLKNTMLAHDILRKLLILDPVNIIVKSSFSKLTVNQLNQLSERLANGETIENIEQTFNYFRNFSRVPFRIIVAYCLHLIKRGDPKMAKFLMQRLVTTNPNDMDFLMTSYRMATSMGDGQWAAQLHDDLEKMLDRKPWKIQLGKLFIETNISESRLT